MKEIYLNFYIEEEDIMNLWRGNNQKRFNDLSYKLEEEIKHPTSYARKLEIIKKIEKVMEDQWVKGEYYE
jgi:hypothetical protein